MINNNELMSRVFGIGMSNPDYRFKKIEVEDIPIMISGNYLVCIPMTEEVKHIGVTGMTGSGKTILNNLLLSLKYWLQKRTCINLNDFQKETFEWNYESDNEVFNKMNKLIGLEPCATPLVYLFPSTKTLIISDKDKKFPLLKFTITIKDIMKNIENFHSLDKSLLYLKNIKEDLEQCNSMSEIIEVINENFPEKEQKLMKFKMLNVFEDLFNNKILDVSELGSPSFLWYEDGKNKYSNRTIQTIMMAGLIPSIQTSDLCNQEFFSAYMSLIVDSIYQNQYYDEYFKKITTNIFVDEIDKLWIGPNGNLIKRSLSLIGTNGRMARIELVWATQHYDKVPIQIRSNTKYMIVFRKSDSKEVNEISKDFAIPKQLGNEILSLNTIPEKGIFEAVCLTTEKFVLYDLLKGRKIYSSEPRRGYIIPPCASHRTPKRK